jgi:SAM-dependent methyltransferase
MNEALWEQNAKWWQRTFTDGADPEYEDQILPAVERHLQGASSVLDIGCGEGQVARRVAASGALVVGLDPTVSQLREAGIRGNGPAYARARAEVLPCRTGAFDAVVVCLALEHVDAFESVFEEVARVLVPGGRFVLVLAHPLLQAPGSGWVADEGGEEHLWRVGAYLGDAVETTEIEPGVTLRFVHRSLSRYVHAMGKAGLLIDDMEEPPPPLALLDEVWTFPEAATIPRILLVSARRIA